MNLQPNAESSLNDLAKSIVERSVFFCRKCYTVFDNPESLESIPCPNCSTEQNQIELVAEVHRPWMSSLGKPRRELTPEARQKMSEGAKLPHPRGAQTPEAKAKMGGFNFKHGLTAKKYFLPRASHGRLALCHTCPFAASEVNPSGDGRCLRHKWTECGYQAAEFFALNQAMLSNQFEAMKELIGEAQAKQLIALRMALNNVIHDGVTVEDVSERDFGEKGSSRETKTKLNPSVEAIGILARSLGGITLQEFLLTPKSGTDETVKHNLAEITSKLLQGFNRPADQSDPNTDDVPEAELAP